MCEEVYEIKEGARWGNKIINNVEKMLIKYNSTETHVEMF
jgi:hypothetical protein